MTINFIAIYGSVDIPMRQCHYHGMTNPPITKKLAGSTPGVQLITLTHWGRDNMAAIFQTTFSFTFSWIKMFEFRIRFHWNSFLRVKLAILQHWLIYWLGADQATSHYLNQWSLVYWRIYASLCLNELTHRGRVSHVIISSHNGGRRLDTKPLPEPMLTSCLKMISWFR